MKLIVGAMIEEISQIIEGFGLSKIRFNGQIELYSGKINDEEVMVLQTGIGKTNAAMSLSAVLSCYNIEEVINIGIVGATKPFTSNEVVVINEASYHDFDLTVFGYEKGQVPRMPVYYESNQASIMKFKRLLNAKEARLYTGDSFTLNTDLTGVFDMEGAALYQVSYQFCVPIVSIKVVSDVIGEVSQHENYQAFEKNCSIRLYELIKHYFMEG